MSDIDLRLRTLRTAARAFRDTPGRRGRVVHLADAGDVLVAGDLHGNVENFRRLLAKADLARHPRRHLVLQELIHGPFFYPKGGDKSHQLLDLLAALKCQYPARVHFLLGNHELAQATNRPVLKNDDNLNRLFRLGVETAYGERADEVYSAYEELLACAPVALRTPNRVFLSHSLPSAGMLFEFNPAALERDPTAEADLHPGGNIYSLLWGRDLRPDTVHAFLQKVDADFLVSGHIPLETGFELPSERHLLLDCLGVPAGYCLLPAEAPLGPSQLKELPRIL